MWSRHKLSERRKSMAQIHPSTCYHQFLCSQNPGVCIQAALEWRFPLHHRADMSNVHGFEMWWKLENPGTSHADTEKTSKLPTKEVRGLTIEPHWPTISVNVEKITNEWMNKWMETQVFVSLVLFQLFLTIFPEISVQLFKSMSSCVLLPLATTCLMTSFHCNKSSFTS